MTKLCTEWLMNSLGWYSEKILFPNKNKEDIHWFKDGSEITDVEVTELKNKIIGELK